MAADRLMVKRDVPFQLYDVDILSADDSDLIGISKDMGLSLSLDEMKVIKEYFANEKRNPSDVELQSLGQAWSEHCCYKSSKVILKEFVFAIDHPDVLSRGDAGVMVFDDDHGYALRIESHNHPSAIEPYGGAATGIGGILRDVVCMGAQPIGLIDPLCFGPIDLEGELPAGVKHPRYLTNGVVGGIRDYGNRVGIPTISGGFFFDESYTGNCLVNVGCVGIVPKKEITNNFAGGPGEYMILCGGRTGRDGIHGVTFASADLTETSDEDSRGAVQLGDPITKEPLIHACLEVNRLGLITGMKDLGGGGLSCVIGEMALEAGGCGADVNLEKVPLKEEGLMPWEIWVSESQERMMVTATEENVPRILEIFEMWDVLATVVAKTTDVPRTRLFWNGEPIFDMDLEFLTGGPMYCRPFTIKNETKVAKDIAPKMPGHKETVLALLSDINVASKEWAIRQYDHEVRASTVVRPMVGKINRTGPGDAAVLQPVPGRWKGLGVAVGCNPWFTSLDPYKGGMSSIDEACRNLVAVGTRPHALTDCLNFGNPEKPERLGEFREAVRGIGEAAKYLGLPIPSGNVSLYNETPSGQILPTPMIMATGLIDDVRKAITADLKEDGNAILIVGETKDEMGGSLLYRKFEGSGGTVPEVDLPVMKENMDALLKAMDSGLVRSCHDCSDGGLAVAVAEMCISGDMGAKLDLSAMDGSDIVKMYSESNSRWIVEVPENKVNEFMKTVNAVRIGTAGGDSLMIEGIADIPVSELRKAWNDPVWNIMGGSQ